MVLMLSELPGQFSGFRRAFDAAGGRLVDVDVCVPVLGGVLLYVERYGREGDGFARQPADALEGEDCVGVIGESLVLESVRGSIGM